MNLLSRARVVMWVALWWCALPVSAKDIDSLRVGTLNVLFHNSDLEGTLKSLGDNPVDILLLQETNDAFEAAVGKGLEAHYPHQRFRTPDKRYKASGFAVLSRFPITAFEHHKAKQNKLGYVRFAIARDGKTLHGINVHLQAVPWPNPKKPEEMQWWAKMSKIVNSGHVKDTQQLIDAAPKEDPVIIAGDFNSFDAWVAIQMMLKAGFQDPFMTLHPNPNLFPTWHRDRQGLNVKFRIDYIFHSGHFTATSATVVPVEGSDHDLVITELMFGNESKASPSDASNAPNAP